MKTVEQKKEEAKPIVSEIVEEVNPKEWTGDLIIKTLKKETITVKSSAEMKVIELKGLIAKEIGMSIDQQLILHEDNTDELDDDQTLKQCGVLQTSFLVVRDRPKEVSEHSATSVTDDGIQMAPWEGNIMIKTLVHSNNWQLTDVNNETLVSDLKEMIHKQQDHEPSTFTLVFGGKTMKEKHPLSRYKISEGSTIVLVNISNTKSPKAEKGKPWKGLFGVKTLTGDTLNLVTASSETVLTLKKKIAERKNGNELWVESLQRLVFDGEELQNDKELGAYGIAQASLLVVLLRRRRQ